MVKLATGTLVKHHKRKPYNSTSTRNTSQNVISKYKLEGFLKVFRRRGNSKWVKRILESMKLKGEISKAVTHNLKE